MNMLLIYTAKKENGVIKILTKSFAENESGDKRLHNVGTLDVMPEFPGGMAKFYHFVADNYRYPEEATEKGVFGKIILSFVVEKDGSLTEKKVAKDAGLGTGEQALKMLDKSPKWKPGLIKGKPVRVAYTLPIQLQLDVE